METSELLKTIDGASLAYLGDSVFELWVRERLIRRGITHSGPLNQASHAYVTAKSQSAAFHRIEDLLTYLGATKAALEMMGVKMVKSIRNDTNRRINCENANIDKTVQAAGTQMDALRRIEETCGLSALPEDLRAVARVRLEHPELSLRDLGAAMEPPLSRSGVNHRLQRIIKFAEELKEG